MKDDLVMPGDEGRGKRRNCLGELQTSLDPKISEWGNPPWVMSRYPCLKFKIGQGGDTQRIETSKYLEEKKTNVISLVAASEKETA